MCIASGPGVDQFDSTRIIGQRQAVRARELFEAASTQVGGRVDYRHSFVNMADLCSCPHAVAAGIVGDSHGLL